MSDLILVLHNIRSVHNVGAMLRTADGAGVRHVYLTGYTPDPVDRFGRKRADMAKASLGAEDSVPWSHADDVLELLAALHKEGVQVVAVEQDVRSVPYTSFAPTGRTALLVGAEVEGVPLEVLDQCNVILEIPMHGEKESLNVSVAAGIVLYHVSEQYPPAGGSA